MKKVIRLTESDLTRIIKRVILEQEKSNDNWVNFVSVMMTMNPKPKLSDFKHGFPETKKSQHLGWFNDIYHLYSVSINNIDEQISIAPQIKEREISNWWKNRGYRFNSLTNIPISFSDAEKVKNDLTDFFKTFPSNAK